jgi:hypothetical protein
MSSAKDAKNIDVLEAQEEALTQQANLFKQQAIGTAHTNKRRSLIGSLAEGAEDAIEGVKEFAQPFLTSTAKNYWHRSRRIEAVRDMEVKPMVRAAKEQKLPKGRLEMQPDGKHRWIAYPGSKEKGKYVWNYKRQRWDLVVEKGRR